MHFEVWLRGHACAAAHRDWQGKSLPHSRLYAAPRPVP
jgi:hypothetical protein